MLSWILTSRAGQAVAAVLAGLLAVFGVYIKGRSDAKQKAEAQKARDYIDTRKRIDEVDSDPLPPDVRDWLRERGKH